jgi:hypothetical protein
LALYPKSDFYLDSTVIVAYLTRPVMYSGCFIKLFNCCETPDPAGITTPITHVAFRMPNELASWFERQSEYRSSSVSMVDISADMYGVLF